MFVLPQHGRSSARPELALTSKSEGGSFRDDPDPASLPHQQEGRPLPFNPVTQILAQGTGTFRTTERLRGRETAGRVQVLSCTLSGFQVSSKTAARLEGSPHPCFTQLCLWISRFILPQALLMCEILILHGSREVKVSTRERIEGWWCPPHCMCDAKPLRRSTDHQSQSE